MFTPLLNLSNEQDGDRDMDTDIYPQQVTVEYPGWPKLGPGNIPEKPSVTATRTSNLPTSTYILSHLCIVYNDIYIALVI